MGFSLLKFLYTYEDLKKSKIGREEERDKEIFVRGTLGQSQTYIEVEV